MDFIINLLLHNPLLYLFVIAAIGYPLGRIKIAGCSIGIASVLFVGIAFGSLHPDLKLPDIIYVLGLVLFVYTIGLASGPSFTASFRADGLRNNIFGASVLFFAFGVSALFAALLGLKPSMGAGMFSGSLTNTPALAAVLDTLKRGLPSGSALDAILAEPVVAYSICYPVGVIGLILSMTILQKLWRIDYASEAGNVGGLGASGANIQSRTVRITKPGATEHSIYELYHRFMGNVVISRMKRDSKTMVAVGDKRLKLGDLVVIVGGEKELDEVAPLLGETLEEHIEFERSELDVRRVFVSNPEAEGRTLNSLDIERKFGAIITRLRRGDMDVVAHGGTKLEPGDRVRVVAPRSTMKAAVAFLGDSYRSVSEVDILTFSLGLAIGLLVGIIPIPLPGGLVISLGFAGGPLIVGLILGSLGRTGKMVWTIPYSANMTIRQMGLVLFLAGIGTKAGYGFASTVMSKEGLAIFLAGSLITTATATIALIVGYKMLRIPFGVLTGMVAGLHTQPAALGYALEQSKNELPNLGYASVFPMATVFKIILAQILLSGMLML